MVKTRSQKRTISDIEEKGSNGNICKKSRTDDSDYYTEDDITQSDSQSDYQSDSENNFDEFSGVNIKYFMNGSNQVSNRQIKNNNHNDPYIRFNNFVESIYDGDFFTREHIEDKIKELRKEVNEDQITVLNNQLQELRNSYKNSSPSILEILKLNTSQSQKQKLLESKHLLENSEILTQQYNSNIKYLTHSVNSQHDSALIALEEKIASSAMTNSSDSYKHKILTSSMSFDNKVIAYKTLQVMQTYEDADSSDYSKYKNWMDSLLSIPFGKLNKIPVIYGETTNEEQRAYMKNIRKTLDEQLSFLEKPKDQIINVVTRMVRNPESTINAIGLHGPKGCGKSSIVSSIAKALDRPYQMISLGGESDASALTGHGFTYVGSNPGRIIEVLRNSKTMNPIILFDELDKISETQHGKEIIGTLIHLTDSTTNCKYNLDKYFSGIEFDLSKVLFVFTYNDPTKIDKILSDRLYKINIDNYTTAEKIEITNTHLINNVLKELNFQVNDVSFSEDAIQKIVQTSSDKNDEGMRDIKTKITIIISRINNLLLTNEEDHIIKLKYKKLYPFYKTLPVKVSKEHVETFLDESVSNDINDNKPPFGMYI